METKLFLLRHGEVESRYHRVFGGQIDMDLSPLGSTQAQALGTFLRNTHFDEIHISPLKRARQTSAPLLENRPVTPVFTNDLREVHFGDWTGLSWQEVHDRFGFSAFEWLHLLENNSIPNAESGPVFRQRIEPCLKNILKDGAGRNIAIVCHGGVIRMMLSILLNLPLPALSSFEIDYASVTEVHCHPNKVNVQLLNFTPWRYLK